MTNRQSKKLRMYITVKDYMDLLNSRAGGASIIFQVKNDFDEMVGDIHQRMQEANISTNGLTQTKEQLKEALAAKALVLSGCLKAYASIQGDAELAKVAGITRTDFTRTKELELALLVQPVIDAIKERIDALVDYGVTAESITDIEASLNEFQDCIGQPRQAIARRSAAIESLDQLFKETDTLLKQRLDPLMLRYEYSDPQLYQNYVNAREIVD